MIKSVIQFVLLFIFLAYAVSYSENIDKKILSYFQKDFNLDFITNPYDIPKNIDNIKQLYQLFLKIKKKNYYQHISVSKDDEYDFYYFTINDSVKITSSSLKEFLVFNASCMS